MNKEQTNQEEKCDCGHSKKPKKIAIGWGTKLIFICENPNCPFKNNNKAAEKKQETQRKCSRCGSDVKDVPKTGFGNYGFNTKCSNPECPKHTEKSVLGW